MSQSTSVTAGKGVVSTNNASGINLEQNTANTGFFPWKQDSAVAFATTSTGTASIGHAGVLTLSSSTAVPVTLLLPDPTTNLGALYTVRGLSAHFHILSGSGNYYASNTSTGATLTLSNSVGSSVALQSDGLLYVVLGNRNAVTIA